ncbi:hypothetical protein [Polaribacter sp. SA4-12]|uniref:hypothetical protein n=1 Tax=Polaribacter sp. SA4-12 TaxID=1312072 RepID=UPI000B3CBEC6|nr:hypothetical protein [Polaribacter sp. SA4-12]ARV15902.1 hypothetical protein BTO07_12450 [Polaribacter sp. SA4-12]
MKFLSIIAILFTFTQCGSIKLENDPPFKFKKASYNNWIGGQPGVRGTIVEIELMESSNIDFDSIFFQNKSTIVEINTATGKTLLIGYFNTSKRQNRDLILDADVTKEMKNKLPDVKKIPFELKEDEAILSYKLGDKINYFKIEDIKKAKPVFYPRTNKG